MAFATWENHQITPPTHSGAEDHVRLLLTKTPPTSSVTPDARYIVSRLYGSRVTARQLDRLDFLKRILFRSYAVTGSLAQSRLLSGKFTSTFGARR